jgi:hypothetical protein
LTVCHLDVGTCLVGIALVHYPLLGSFADPPKTGRLDRACLDERSLERLARHAVELAVEVGRPLEVALREAPAQSGQKRIARVEPLVLGTERLDVPRRGLRTSCGMKGPELAEVPVRRGGRQPLVCELEDDERRSGGEERRDLRHGALEVVDVMERAAGHDGVERVRLVEPLDRDAAEDRALWRLGVDCRHVVAAARQVEGELAAPATNLEDARRRRGKVCGHEESVLHRGGA